MEYVLKTNSLCKNYGHFKALNGLSMNVPKGSIYGLIGKNGAGKTTLISLTTNISSPATLSGSARTAATVSFPLWQKATNWR